SSATFVLVVEEQGEPRQVNLFRRARTAASLRLEAEQQRQRAEACEQQLSRCHDAAAPSGLLGRVPKLGGSNGIHLQWHKVRHPRNQVGEIEVWGCFTTRVEVEDGQREAAIELRLSNQGTGDWTVEGVSLVSAEGQPLAEVQVLSDAALPAESRSELHLVVGPTPRQLRGTYTLKLWGGGSEVTVESIVFP
ncbi:MAG TPA: DUF2381 family protein, partial [Myxococcaceae bacterium]|nr:DUF2381 family protein [Myxococcaceae bacterium]